MKRFAYLWIMMLFLSFCADNDNVNDKAETYNEGKPYVTTDDNTDVDMNIDTSLLIAAGTSLNMESVKFLLFTASSHQMEIDLGNTAQQKGTTDRIRNFGAMMARDHTNALRKLREMAAARKASDFTDTLLVSHVAKKVALNNKNGQVFDQAYIRLMADEHQKDIQYFERVAKNSTDPAIKTYAYNTLPVLRIHLDSAKAIRDTF